MKKSLALLSAAALPLGALSGCGGTQSGTADDPGAADKGVVNVYNWGVYIDESVLEEGVIQCPGCKQKFALDLSDECGCEDCEDCEDGEYAVTCPACGEEFTVDEDTVMEGGIECPACGEFLEFELDGDDQETENDTEE